MKKNLIVTGIGTAVGKTVVSAILVKMLEADYWKPISCGAEEDRDTHQIKNLVAEPDLCCHPETYHFLSPLSPHHAGSLEGVDPLSSKMIPPQSEKRVVIESVGGVLVPLNNIQVTMDVFCKWGFEWIIVSRNYLGSINHTLLTIEALKQRGADILGLVFNGPENIYSEEFITNYSKLPVLGRVKEEEKIDATTIERYSQLWKTDPFWKEKIR